MAGLTHKQQRLIRRLTNPLLFNFFTFFKVPFLFWSGTKIVSFSSENCTTKVRYKFLNANPFNSMYFAVQSMAAEFATAAQALLAIEGASEKVVFIVVQCEGEFYKKVEGMIHFRSQDFSGFQLAVEEAIETGKQVEYRAKAEGLLADGTPASNFYFTWSFKRKRKS